MKFIKTGCLYIRTHNFHEPEFPIFMKAFKLEKITFENVSIYWRSEMYVSKMK